MYIYWCMYRYNGDCESVCQNQGQKEKQGTEAENAHGIFQVA